MNKKIFKILMATIILIAAIGAVNAVDSNFTDDSIAVEEANDISVADEDVEAASIEDANDEIGAEDNGEEVIAAGENEERAVVCDSEKLASDSDDSSDSDMEYKTFVIGKMKFPKKYLKLDSMEKKMDKYKKKIKKYKSLYKKTHANKYKKAIKKFKAKYKKQNKQYKKSSKELKSILKKELKKFKKTSLNKIRNIVKYNWQAYSEAFSDTQIKGKYVYLIFKMEFCRPV